MNSTLFDHVEKLPVFLEVLRVGSIRRASRSLGVSQPGVSRVIQILEETLSDRLFIRSQNGVIPTELAVKLAHTAKKILIELSDFELSTSTTSTQVKRIRLGTYESIAIYFFPDFLSQTFKKNEEYQIDLVTSDSQSLEQKLKQNSVDAIISVGHPQSKSIISKKIFDDDYGFFTHPHLAVDSSTPILLFPTARDQAGTTLAKHIEASIFSENPQFMCESFEPIKALAKKKLGVAVLPLRVAQSSVVQKELAELKKTQKFGKHTIYFSYLKHRDGDSDLLNLFRRIEDFEV